MDIIILVSGFMRKYPLGSWVLECILFCPPLWAGAAQAISKQRSGADVSQACILLAVLSILMSPWTLAICCFVAKIHEQYGWGGLSSGCSVGQAFGFAYIIPATIFSKILDRADSDALAAKKGK